MKSLKKVIEKLYKLIQEGNSPVVDLEKKENSSEYIKKELIAHYSGKIKVIEDAEAYHLHIIK